MASTASAEHPVTKTGVAPLRAGKGTSFLLRRLHSLSGIVPIGLFLIEHFVSNAFATNGPEAYTQQVKLLSSFPFVVGLELVGIWLPILYHSLYGFFIWARGDSNVSEYPWAGNWMYNCSAGRALLPSLTSSGTPGICGLAEFICLPTRMRLSARYRRSLRIPGRSRFMPWESSALRGISPMACGYSQ